MKIAVAQLNSQEDWRKNLLSVATAVERAVRFNAQAIVFPENALYMGNPEHLSRIARELWKDKAMPTIQSMARKHRIAILLGSYPEYRRDSTRVFNTSLFIDERGRILGRYRKIHLFDVTTPGRRAYRESKNVCAGDKLVTFKWRGIILGMSICYDVRFPEMYRDLARRGADCLIVPSAFTHETGKEHWHTLLRARAIENLATVIAPAQTGRHPLGRRTFGHSLVVSPWGKVLLDAGTRPGIQFARLSPGESNRLRRQFPVAG
ncbi:MAG TPA: carbon-nitrogen hydrolase family protein [Bdellovibrionota bacterium]|nr:carbon-nitrogen hydrolase family protein [Bdellovibrionota bacterium]